LDIVSDKIVKTRQLRKADAFRVRVVANGETIQEREGFIRCDLANRPITIFPAEWLNDGLIRA
jgi:hypothetical protein